VEYHPILDAAMRLRRAPKMAWLWRTIAFFSSQKRKQQFKRFSGVVLLEKQ
jgi:hypothetical protein